MDHDSLDPNGIDYQRLVTSLRGMGLVKSAQPRIVPLTGGVSSLIVLVEDEGNKFCAKSALAKLKVAEDWQAPVHRNQSEVAWMRIAAKVAPTAVPAILGEDPAENIFAMQWLDPDAHPVWKQQMMDGVVSASVARDVAIAFGKIHAATAGDGSIAADFANDVDFDALRLDPYLRAAAKAHPDVAGQILAILDTTASSHYSLIHGDVSPKNILVGPAGPVILDAECATYGDPAFDIAFCLNHLILKAVHLPDCRTELAQSYRALVQAYLALVTWEPAAEIEARTAAILPALALARVDGKSPAEYLTTTEQEQVRQAALALIKAPVTELGELLNIWMEKLT